ncbi:MAG: sugar phosphate isomerase/epimerase [Verrucomicrobiales bacterium]|jgi:sugar phosphate isomerase/epimerase
MNASNYSRRQFLRTTSASALLGLSPLALYGQDKKPARKFTLNLVGGALGVNASQNEIIALAAKHGYESVEARPGELVKLAPEEIKAITDLLSEHHLVWGTAGLPVEFRKDDARFEEDLKALPAMAKALQTAGVDRVSTWLMPSHADLTYLQNFERYANRLRRVAQILKDHGQRLGMEYVGTQSLLTRGHYPFIHTLAETQELMARIGTGNVGVVLDSWHWWTAGDSTESLRTLKNKDVILVDLNDAPSGVVKRDQQDGRRQLPASTGVIPIKEFIDALLAIGYDGPVRSEPFNQTLNDLDNDPACKASIDALKKARALSGV